MPVQKNGRDLTFIYTLAFKKSKIVKTIIGAIINVGWEPGWESDLKKVQSIQDPGLTIRTLQNSGKPERGKAFQSLQVRGMKDELWDKENKFLVSDVLIWSYFKPELTSENQEIKWVLAVVHIRPIGPMVKMNKESSPLFKDYLRNSQTEFYYLIYHELVQVSNEKTSSGPMKGFNSFIWCLGNIKEEYKVAVQFKV
ncbi:hypothetical protein GQR58_028346 [Nymphon striatum]|nr:hypothetical protein GQR58_028346 [Nymphon striatum]